MALTLEEFLPKARQLNPDYTDEEHIQAYEQRYGRSKPVQTVSAAPLTTYEEFLPKARALNPDYSDEEHYAAWQEKYGARGAREKGPGFWESAGSTAKDIGLKTAQGVVDVAQSAVGIASLASGGKAGEILRAWGWNPEEANKFLESKASAAQQEADRAVQRADGFVDTLVAYKDNPRAILGAAAEAAPGIATMGLMARKAAAMIAEKAAAGFGGLATEAGREAAKKAIEAQASKLIWVASGTEGALSAGQIADEAQGAGRTYSDYLLPSIGAGVGTAVIGGLAGKMMGSAEVGFFTGAEAAKIKGNLSTRMAKSIFSEGVLEEMPQSAQEQVFQNIAMGKPWNEGVSKAAASGLVVGSAMGGVMGGVQRPTDPSKGQDPIVTERQPDEMGMQPSTQPEVLPPQRPAQIEGPIQPGEVRGGKVYAPGEVLDVSPLPDVSPVLNASSLDDAIANAVGVVRGATETGKARAAEFARMTAKAKNETDALLAKAPEKRAAFDVPTLPGPETQPATLLNQPSPIVPGQAFTPRVEPVDDPRARLAEERARMVAQRERQRMQQPVNPVSEPVPPAPAVEPAETPLPSQVDLAYPSSKQVRDLIHEKGFHLDTPVFREYLKMAVGKEKFSELTPQELQRLAEKVQKIKAPQQPTPLQEAPPQVPLTPTEPKEKPYAPVTTIPEAQVPRSELPPEKNAEMLLRAEKAKADLEIAGTERGGRFFQEQTGAGSTQEVTGLKSATADWYKDLTSGPSPAIRGDRKQSAREKIEQAIQKIIKDKGADRGKAVEQVKAALLQDTEFHQTEWGRDLNSILHGEWPSWVEKPQGVTQATENAAEFQNVPQGTHQATVEEPKKVPLSRKERLAQQKQKMDKQAEPLPSEAPWMEPQPATASPEREPAPPAQEAAPTTEVQEDNFVPETDEEIEAQDARPLSEEEIVGAFMRASHSMADAENRWNRRRERGLADNELKEAIAYEFGAHGASSGPRLRSIMYKGGNSPVLEIEKSLPIGKVIKGKELLTLARNTLNIPTPQSKAEEPKRAGQEEEPFSLSSPEVSKPKAKEQGPEQLSIDVPPPTIGSRPIIGREATLEEAPLFSKNAQTPDAEQTSLSEPIENPDESPVIPKQDSGSSAQSIAPEITPAQLETAQSVESAQSPTEILATALRTVADQIQGKQSIVDVGEKVGGARKDLVGKSAEKATKPKPEGPAWERRYQVSQIVSSRYPGEEGKWTIRDTKKTDWKGQARQVGGLFDTEEEAKRMIPVVVVAETHRVYKDRDGKWEIFKKSGDRKLIHVVNQKFDTEEDAKRYLAQNAAEILETKTFFGEEILPRPEKVERIGTDRRNGRNVNANDFKDTFGFRAVEFGNWQNQDDRQELMNYAYDGLHDLAETLKIPPQAIGLNGDLALAFGSRGHGLSGAAAHYERNYGVINLTKMQGAGHLAHEWFHAADHYFGRQDTKASSEKEKNERGDLVYKAKAPSQDYASHGFRMTGSQVRPEVRSAYKTLIRTMLQKGEQFIEDAQRADKFVAQARERVAEKLDSIRNGRYGGLSAKVEYGKRNTEPATAEQLAEFDAIAQRILEGETFEQRFISSDMAKKSRRYIMAGRWSNDALEKISSIYKAVRGRSGFGSGNQAGVLDDLRQLMNFYKERLKMLADAQAGTEKTKQVPTSYAMEAKSMDQGRKESYWATEHEMAARAFAAYVEDKLKADGKKSDFITYQTFGAVPTIWGWKKPYPEGAERQAINEAFDKFVGTLQTRETDKGIALYQRDIFPDPSPEEAETVQKAIEGKTVLQAAQFIAQSAPSPSHRLIAEKVEAQIKRLQLAGMQFELHVAHDREQVPVRLIRTRGMTWLPENSMTTQVWIQGADVTGYVGSSYETVLHELIHAATQAAIHVGMQEQYQDTAIGKSVTRILDVSNRVIDHFGERFQASQRGEVELTPFEQKLAKRYANALDDPGETVAWALSNHEMQKYLESVPYEQESLWTRFVNAIREFLGLQPAQKTALSEVLRVSEDLLNAPMNDIMPKFKSAWMPSRANQYKGLLNNQRTEAIDKKDTQETGTIDPTEVRDRLAAVKTGTRPYLLGALGLEQLSQVYGNDHAEVRRYNKATQAMEADFTEMSRESDAVARAWTDLKIPVADKMAKVMEDARFLNFDPDPERGQSVGGKKRGATDDIAIQYGMDGEPDAKSQAKQALRTRFEQLPEDAKAVYRMARDFYTNMAEQRFQALKERIERAGGTPENTRKLVDRLQIAYEQVRSKVYFPFTRFGENIVVAKKMENGVEKDREVHAFESVAEAQKFATMMKLKGWQVKQTVAREYSVDKEGPASKIVRQMHDIIKELGQGQQGLPGVLNLEDQLLDALNQSFLQALPDMSYAKHFIHAKDVKGASRDALRSFAHSALHGAHHISRIRHADQVTKALLDLDTKINETVEGDTTEARQVYNELTKRHNDIMNPNTHPFSAWLGQLGFTMSLGGVVATGITNATQVPLVTYPWLGARYGFGKASAALARAYKDFLDPRTLNKDSLFDASKSKLISESERKMLLELARRGHIDLTQTMDLAGLSSRDNLSRKARTLGTVGEKVTRMLGFTFHVPEVMNRQVTALSTFRLEKEKGSSFDEALERAQQAIQDTHFIYQSHNRPRYMSGNFLRVLTMFKQYSQNIAYTYGRAASIWLDRNIPANDEEGQRQRQIAKRQLLSMLVLQFGAAGALGMPFFGTPIDLLMAVVAAMGDDDEKRDWEVALRQWLDGQATSLAEAFIDDKEQARAVGKELAEVVAHGASRLTPFDMASRLGQNDLFFREPQREREGRQAVMDWGLALGGPVPSYFLNALLGIGDVAKGMSELNAGFFMRGVEELTPAVLRHGVRSLRYTLEGVRTRDEYKQLDLTTSEKLGQAFGFQPARVAEMYESTTAVKNKEHRILNEQKDLKNRFARAVDDQDDNAKQRILEDIRGFNERNPMFAITSNTLNRSLKARRQHEAGMERGMYLPPRRRALLEEGDFGDF